MPPKRLADDEGAGAVDRIDHPAIFTFPPDCAEFLADDAVLGIGLGKDRPQRCLGREVGRGNGIEFAASFMVNGTAGPEMRQYDLSRPVGKTVGGGEQSLEIGIGPGCHCFRTSEDFSFRINL